MLGGRVMWLGVGGKNSRERGRGGALMRWSVLMHPSSDSRPLSLTTFGYALAMEPYDDPNPSTRSTICKVHAISSVKHWKQYSQV
jgi:hypothetical protein